jgi:CSLREA domain-containing protein
LFVLAPQVLRPNAKAGSNSITVNSLGDQTPPPSSGFCTLREAISNANSPGTDTSNGNCALGSGDDVITFSLIGTITIGSSLPSVRNVLSIAGTGQTVDGGGSSEVFAVGSGATLTLSGLTISHGNSATGGGVDNGGTLTVTNMTFSGNSSGTLGAGGAIYSTGSLTVTAATFSGNAVGSSGAGGAIFNGGGTARIAKSTFFGNTAGGSGFGGAIFSNGGTLTVNSGTFSSNGVGAGGQGGGIFVSSSGSALLENSILAGSTGGNCAGSVENGGYNISDDGACGFGSSTVGVNGQTLGDNVNPRFDPTGLQNNGGPTQTIAIEPGSPALDAIPAAQCLLTDQRGAPRPDPLELASANPACDVGAKSLAISLQSIHSTTTRPRETDCVPFVKR